MSRRSRKREISGEKRWWGKAAVGLLVVGLLGLGVTYGVLRSYLHSDAFRKFLSGEVSEAAGITGEFSPFRWEGLAVNTDGFEAKGQGLVTGIRADGLHTEVGLGGVRRGVWEIRGSSVRRLEVSVDARNQVAGSDGSLNRVEPAASDVNRELLKKTKRPAWLPREAELQGVDIRELMVKAILDQGLATATGLKVHAEPAGAKDAYRAVIEGGAVRLPFAMAPELRLDRIQLRCQDGQVFLTDAKMAVWGNGSIQSSGEWDMKSRRYSLEGNATGMKCEEILSADWAKRLTGDVVSSFTSNNSQGFPTAGGKLTLQNGVLTALPLFDALAAYSDTRRFRVLTLNEAHTEWQWKPGELVLTHLVLASEGLVRLEGGMVLRGQQIDGQLRLGLAPGTLARIPGAETDVFAPGELGLLWTSLHLTGTLDNPKEDLTDRLIAAAGMRMFDQLPETGEKVIKFSRSMLGEPSTQTIEKGVEILEKRSKTVRKVSGILDGILGTGKPSEPPVEAQ